MEQPEEKRYERVGSWGATSKLDPDLRNTAPVLGAVKGRAFIGGAGLHKGNEVEQSVLVHGRGLDDAKTVYGSHDMPFVFMTLDQEKPGILAIGPD